MENSARQREHLKTLAGEPFHLDLGDPESLPDPDESSDPSGFVYIGMDLLFMEVIFSPPFFFFFKIKK